MFHNKSANIKIDRLYEIALRMVSKDYEPSFELLLDED